MKQETLDILVQDMVDACNELDEGQYSHRKQARAAICSALSGFLPDPMVAKAVGVTRTVVIYHTRRHSMNMSGWNGYVEKYLLCSSMYRSKVMDCDVCGGEKMVTISSAKKPSFQSPCPLCKTQLWLSSM